MITRRVLALVAVALAVVLPATSQEGAGDCGMCHDDVAEAMTRQVHMRIRSFEVDGRPVGCVGCHGEGEAHMEEGDPALIRTFAEPTAEDAAVCLDCHRAKGTPEWTASTHAMEEILCFECHTVHRETNPLESCADCHQEVYAELQLPSHHPVREGKLTCVSCHDPHLATEAQLATHRRVNDLCFDCHQSKEGPYIFEHEPVVEDCRLCHRAHGAVADNLLTANQPMLCLQCHDIHFHAGLLSPDEGHVDVGGREFENPWGAEGMNRAFTTSCTQCHSQIHGSDLPTQSLAGGGHGMVR